MGAQYLIRALLCVCCCVLLASTGLCWAAAGEEGGPTAAPWLRHWYKKLPGMPPPSSLARLAWPLHAYDQEDALVATKELEQRSVELLGETGNVVLNQDAISARLGLHTHLHEAAELQGFFLKLSDLAPGSQLLYPKLAARDPLGRTFLPPQLATTMSSPANLLQILTKLNIPTHSSLATRVTQALSLCAAHTKGEREEMVSCHASIESMLDSALLEAASEHVSVLSLSPQQATFHPQRVTVLAEPTAISRHGSKFMSCHDVGNPLYLVYACHAPSSSLILDVALQKEDGSSMHGIAVCHKDTRDWDANNVAFTMLGVKPGETPVCHWLPQNTFVWMMNAPQEGALDAELLRVVMDSL